MKKNLRHLEKRLAAKLLEKHEKVYLKGGIGSNGGTGGFGGGNVPDLTD